MNNNKNVHEEKMSKKKTYDGYIKMYEENSKKESFVKTVAKTENGSKDLFNEHVEKVKEIDKKMWDPKQNPKFQCHFWPQFGKRLIPVLRGDKTVFQMKDRARSKEKPENVTMRLQSADHRISFPKDLDKTKGLKDQLDNYYPWTLNAVCNTVNKMDSIKKKMAPMANSSKTIVEIANSIKD